MRAERDERSRSGGVVTCRPGHAPRHPDFAEGNEAATTHGAHSERRWSPLAHELADDAVSVAPWLARPAFAGAVRAWSVAEAQARLVDAWLDRRGLLDAKGVPRPATVLSDRLHRRAAHLRSQLGLTPAGLARLLASFGGVPGGDDVLQRLIAEGRKVLDAHEAAAGSPLTAGDASELLTTASDDVRSPDGREAAS